MRTDGTPSRSMRSIRATRTASLTAKYAVLLIYSAFSLVPFLWMVSAGFKRPEDVLTVPVKWIPPEFVPRNFYEALFDERFAGFTFARFLWNSLFVATITTLLAIVLATAVGYGFAKFRFRGNTATMWTLLGTTLLPFSSVVIPLYLVVRQMNLLDTQWALIVPFAISGVTIFVARQFIKGIPDALIDSARIDGATEMQIYRRIIIPLSGPAITTVGVMTFLFSWSQFLWPLIVESSQSNYTAPLGLSLLCLGSTFNIDYSIWMAAATLSTIPPLIFFLILQGPYLRGLEAMSGIKG